MIKTKTEAGTIKAYRRHGFSWLSLTNSPCRSFLYTSACQIILCSVPAGYFLNMPRTGTILVSYYYLISDQVTSISICCSISPHVKRTMLNNTERFYVFSFLHYILYIYDNVELETRHVPIVDDLRTSTGIRTTSFSGAALDSIIKEVGRVLWHINHCRLFYDKSCLYLHIEYICFVNTFCRRHF